MSSHVYSLQSSPPQWCRQPTLRNKSPHIASLQYPGCQQPVGPVCTNNTPVFRLGAAWLGAAWPRLVCFKSLNGKLITAANMCSAVATTHHQDMWHGRRSSGGNAMLHTITIHIFLIESNTGSIEWKTAKKNQCQKFATVNTLLCRLCLHSHSPGKCGHQLTRQR